MAKDPAILFYAQDFITGTMFFSYEQKGKYITLLCAQHQHGGLIDKKIFNSIVGDDELLRDKFIESEGGFFNERMMKEIEKRSKKSSNLSANAKQMWSKRKENECKSNAIVSDLHMPIENEDAIENEVVNKVVNKRKEQILEYCKIQCYPLEEGESFFDHYQALGWKTSAGMGIADWKAKMRSWHREQLNRNKNNGTSKRIVNQGASPDKLAEIVARRKINQDRKE